MPTSVVEICNIALGRLAQAPIQTLESLSNEATWCKRLYDRARTTVLRAHAWKFAMKSAYPALIDDGAADPDYFTLAYQIPSDCLHVVSAVDDIPGRPVHWEVVGDQIWTDHSPLKIRYVYDEKNTTKFDPAFIECLGYKLAAELAMPVTGNPDLSSAMSQAYSITLRQAQAQSSRQARKALRIGHEYLDSRK